LSETLTAMRIDRLLVYLRFARTRSRASSLVEEGHIRRNGAHVRRTNEEIRVGDVLTMPLGTEVRIVEILALPARRGSPALAKSYYRDLDRCVENAIAANQHDD